MNHFEFCMSNCSATEPISKITGHDWFVEINLRRVVWSTYFFFFFLFGLLLAFIRCLSSFTMCCAKRRPALCGHCACERKITIKKAMPTIFFLYNVLHIWNPGMQEQKKKKKETTIWKREMHQIILCIASREDIGIKLIITWQQLTAQQWETQWESLKKPFMV